MQFHRTGNLHQVVRVTGPTHNYLAIEFGEPAAGGVVVDADQRPGEPVQLAADAVLAQIERGLDAANRRLGTRYAARRIQFVAGDTPPATIYARLAEALLERMHATRGDG